VSKQGAQARQGGGVRQFGARDGQPAVDGVESRPLKPSNQVSVAGPSLHGLMVPVRSATTPHQTADEAPTSAYHSTVDLEVAIPLAAARAGYTLGQLAAYMEMDASNLSKVLRGNGHVSLQRLLKLPFPFWREFLPLLAEPVGMTVAHEEIAEIALRRFGAAVEAFVSVVPVLLKRAV
jgi:hypothetical protein